MRRGTLTLQARYVYPVEGPPIRDGSVTIEHGRIGWVGPATERRGDMDLGNVALTPGFVNAHTHLELEPLARSVRKGSDPQDEISWLRRVVEQRRSGSDETRGAAVRRNLKASLDGGTTLLGDTTTAGLSWGPIAECPCAPWSLPS